ncbi:DNA polymerase III subunit alpha [Spirillospora sp. NBC_01491]|uniref:DNA polymerase III subunit alpha n=1 Tax=Spirillospora sp. NBC_01491 TaxID=2976007 RepID=UPI002E32DAEC|nr:DNA polymerase III subunit alpha [Spirillospora sp. NBC_01491]
MHLHVASAYSLRYGVAQPRALAERAAGLGMETLALTDRDGLYGAVRHVRACRDAGIRPVLGADLALDYDGDPAGTPEEGRVVVLATGRTGWTSLCRLVTAAHAARRTDVGPGATGERGRRPAVRRELVGTHSAGLVVLLGPASDVGRAVAARRPDLAARRLAAWRETAEPVLEIVDHQDRGDGHRAARMLALARETGVPAVLGNAVRYLEAADHPVAQVLDVTRRLVPLDRRHLDDRTGHAYLKSEAEMRRVAELGCGAAEADALVAATRRLAERCALDPVRDLGMDRVHLPDAGDDPHARLAARCAGGLARRGLDRSGAAADRLADELAVIARKGLAAYFLTVADAAELVRSRGIRCAVRGSGAGSLVNHLIGISDLDPLRHGLLMERFLADSRPGLPDIDLDVESARRLEAYRLLFDRFGAESTACVSMMETYRARSAIRDVGNAVGLPPSEIDVIAKAFPHVRAEQIRAALHDLPELRQSNLAQERLEVLFRIAERLDGLPRHIALHPCGVLLSNPTLPDRTPLEPSAAGFPMSQFDKDDVEAMGLLKLDVIGVRMQSAMAHTVAEVARVEGERIALEDVPRDDAATFELIRTSRTLGCFQIESPGQRELIGRLQPRDLDDLVIDISLFRPGPVGSDMVTPYLESRAGRREPDYPHPDLAGALRESLGIVVFHEQVLRVVAIMTGCGLSQAEAARRSLTGAKGQAVVGAWFRTRALARGYGAAVVERVWRTLAAFGAFGFCKAHAASFALPTYQSAWLKRHHTAAFFAGVLTHDPGMYPKRVILDDARHFGVPILPLDVNRSAVDWHVEPVSAGGPVSAAPPIPEPEPMPAPPVPPPVPSDQDAASGASGASTYGIRVALNEVKGITDAEAGRIVAERPYRSLSDFWRRARVSRPIAERLVLAGGFDALYQPGPGGGGPAPRRDLLCRVGALDRATARPGRGVGEGQLPLGDETGDVLGAGIVEEIRPGELPPMTPSEMVEAELEVLGLDVSRHVLTFYGGLLRGLGAVRARDLADRPGGGEVLVAGVKVATQTPAVRSGQRVIFATLDDATGPVDLAFFESVQERCAAIVFGSWLLVARGRVRRAGARAVSITATACWDLPTLEEERRRGGIEAVRRLMARPGPGGEGGGTGRRVVHATGFATSPYADIGHAGDTARRPPARLWHASGGSSGPTEPR